MSKPRANAAVQAVGTSLRRRFCVRLRTGWECFANGAENRGIRGRFPPVLFPRLRAPILPAREGRKTIGTNHILSRSPLWLHTRPFTEPTPFAFGGQGQDEARPVSFSPSPLAFFVCLFISNRFARGVKINVTRLQFLSRSPLWLRTPPFTGPASFAFGGQGQGKAGPASFSPSPLAFFVCLFISNRFARGVKINVAGLSFLFRSPSSLHTHLFTRPAPFAFGGQGQDEARPASFSPSPLTFFVCLFISKRFARGVKNKRRGTVIFVPLALLASHSPFHGVNALCFRRARAGRCGKLPHLPRHLLLFLRLPFYK